MGGWLVGCRLDYEERGPFQTNQTESRLEFSFAEGGSMISDLGHTTRLSFLRLGLEATQLS